MRKQYPQQYSLITFLLAGVLVLLSACSSAQKVTDSGYLGQEDFVKGSWTIPRGDIKNCQRELSLLVNVEEDGAKQTNLCKYVEAELGRIKRFKTYVAWNNGAMKLASDLLDIGEAAQTVRTKPSLDLALSISLLSEREMMNMKYGNVRYGFKSDITCTLSDVRTGDQLFSRVFEGVVVAAESVMGTKGRVGGFDPNSTEDVEAMLEQSVTVALRAMVSQLGNEYPVVARISNATQSRLSIDKGTDMGLFGAENFIVVEDIGGGLYVPIIKAGSETTMKTNGTLKILAFNKSDGDANPLIGSFQENPGNYVEKRAGALLAVTKGLGVPEEWDATYNKVMAPQER